MSSNACEFDHAELDEISIGVDPWRGATVLAKPSCQGVRQQSQGWAGGFHHQTLLHVGISISSRKRAWSVFPLLLRGQAATR